MKIDWAQFLIVISVAMCLGGMVGMAGMYMHWSPEKVMLLATITAIATSLILGRMK